MASIRIGINSEFNLVDSKVGIGTTNPTELVDVRGQIYSDNSIGAGGISTVTTYQGFLDTKQTIKSSSEGTVVAGTLSGEIIIDGEVTVSSATTYTSGLSELTATNKFTLPGITGSRPTEGTTRFNENLGALEFYTGVEWRAVNSYVDMGNRGRAVIAGGRSGPLNTKSISYINFSTFGNSINFGELSDERYRFGSCASSVRGLFGAGLKGATPSQSATSNIEYITLASGCTGISFGTLTDTTNTTASCSSSTRGLWAGGYNNYRNIIDYVEINTLGNAVDFGDLTNLNDGRNGQKLQQASCASATRGMFIGGTNESPSVIDYSLIDTITIASKGNAKKMGDLTATNVQSHSACNSVRAIHHEGRGVANTVTKADLSYSTISSLGLAQHFGDLTAARFATNGAAASQTGAIFPGGSSLNVIDYVNINTLGDGVDFGDITAPGVWLGGSVSDSHGGLGGF